MGGIHIICHSDCDNPRLRHSFARPVALNFCPNLLKVESLLGLFGLFVCEVIFNETAWFFVICDGSVAMETDRVIIWLLGCLCGCLDGTSSDRLPHMAMLKQDRSFLPAPMQTPVILLEKVYQWFWRKCTKCLRNFKPPARQIVLLVYQRPDIPSGPTCLGRKGGGIPYLGAV